MGNPYIEVARSYIREWDRRIAGGLLLLLLLGALITTDRRQIGEWPLAPIFAIFGYLAYSAAALVKEQFANPRARLIPGFVKTHLLVAAIVTVVACLILSCILASVSAASLLATASVAIGTCALIGWGVYFGLTGNLLIACSALCLYLIESNSWHAIGGFLRGNAPEAAATILGSALVALGLLGVKLADLNEDEPEYHRRAMDGSASYRSPSDEQLGTGDRKATESFWGGISSRWRDRRFERALSAPITTWRQDARRLWAATGQPSLAWAYVIIVIAVGMVGQALAPKEPFLSRVSCFPLLMLAVFSNRWRRVLVQEVFKPFARKQLLYRVGLVLAIEYIKAWCFFVVIVTLICAVVSPALLLDRNNWIACGVLFCAYVLSYGVVAWLILLRSAIAWGLGMLSWYMAVVMVSLVLTESRLTTGGRLCAGFVLIAISIPIISGAYRAWLEADLD